MILKTGVKILGVSVLTAGLITGMTGLAKYFIANEVLRLGVAIITTGGVIALALCVVAKYAHWFLE